MDSARRTVDGHHSTRTERPMEADPDMGTVPMEPRSQRGHSNPWHVKLKLDFGVGSPPQLLSPKNQCSSNVWMMLDSPYIYKMFQKYKTFTQKIGSSNPLPRPNTHGFKIWNMEINKYLIFLLHSKIKWFLCIKPQLLKHNISHLESAATKIQPEHIFWLFHPRNRMTMGISFLVVCLFVLFIYTYIMLGFLYAKKSMRYFRVEWANP